MTDNFIPLVTEDFQGKWQDRLQKLRFGSPDTSKENNQDGFNEADGVTWNCT